jgi:hypothetical protein
MFNTVNLDFNMNVVRKEIASVFNLCDLRGSQGLTAYLKDLDSKIRGCDKNDFTLVESKFIYEVAKLVKKGLLKEELEQIFNNDIKVITSFGDSDYCSPLARLFSFYRFCMNSNELVVLSSDISDLVEDPTYFLDFDEILEDFLVEVRANLYSDDFGVDLSGIVMNRVVEWLLWRRNLMDHGQAGFISRDKWFYTFCYETLFNHSEPVYKIAKEVLNAKCSSPFNDEYVFK